MADRSPRRFNPAWLLLPLLILPGWWLSTHIGVSYHEKRHPPVKEIRNNPYAGLQALLQQYNINSEVFFQRSMLDKLPPVDHTLVITHVQQPLLAIQTQQLLDWVNRGGQLIYEVNFANTLDPASDLIAPLQLSLGDSYTAENRDKEWRHAAFLLDGEKGYIRLEQRHLLLSDNPEAELLAQSELGAVAYRVPHGEGQLIAITDSNFMNTPEVWAGGKNDDGELLPKSGINSHDNATFSYQLLKNSTSVWFLRDDGSISLLTLTKRYFPYTTFFTTVWLCLFFLYLLKRQGPQIHHEPDQQQNLKQHLVQVGRFHWAVDKADLLLQHWRQRVVRRLTQRQPQLAGCSVEDMASNLEQQTGLNQQHIIQAINARVRTPSELIHYLRILRALWKL